MPKKLKYVPILKWKAAEMTALEHISEEDGKNITPLVEIVLPGVNAYKDKERKVKKTDSEIHAEMVKKMIEHRFTEIPEEIETSWGNKEIYVDVTLLHDEQKTSELKISALNALLSGAEKKKLKVIPVVNIADDSSLIANMKDLISKQTVQDICLRITPSSLRDLDTLDKKMSSLLDTFAIEKENVHLLIDLKVTDSTPGAYDEAFNAAQKIKDLTKFKEFIFASGAFPSDMAECSLEEPTYLSRTDWSGWKNNIAKKGTARIPVYSDYTIRYPLYNDSLQFFESTSSLKYSLDSQWMIMKGKKRALGLYLAHAYLLVQQQEFKDATYKKGADFSFGDGYISKKAKHFDTYRKDNSVKGTGRTQDWIAAGISHHVALAMRQLSSLLGYTESTP